MTTGRINQISVLSVRGSKPLVTPGPRALPREDLGAEASEAIKPSGANRLGERANEDWNAKTASEFLSVHLPAPGEHRRDANHRREVPTGRVRGGRFPEGQRYHTECNNFRPRDTGCSKVS